MKFFKIRYFSFFLTAIFLLGIGSSFCLADVSGGTNDTLQAMAAVLAVIIKFLTFISLLIMSWGGELMGTDFLTSDAAMNGIRPMWVYIRNITNICFVLILLFLSFSNLFSFGEGSWTIKEKLPKIIISLIAVNFSLLAFRVVLDAVNVGSTAILSIADTAVQEKGGFDVASLLSTYSSTEKGTPCPLTTKQSEKIKEGDYASVDKEMKENGCEPFYKAMNNLMCSGGNKSRNTECFFEVNSPTMVKGQAGNPTTSNLMLSFGVYFQHLEQLPALAANLGGFSSVLDSVVFSSVMALAYIVALVAVFVALLMRMVALWFFMIFSPLLMAGWIMGFGVGGDISGKLLTYVIMPLKISAAFALSFVMIAVLIEYEPVDSVQIIKFGYALEQFAGLNAFGILWKIATVVVFWMAAFAAIDGTHAEGIINGIKNGAQSAGSFMAKAATVDRQVLKFPGMEGKISLSSLSRLPEALETAQRTSNADNYRKMARDFNLSTTNADQEKQLKRFDIDYKKGFFKDNTAMMKDVKETTSAEDLYEDPNTRKSLLAGIERSGLNLEKGTLDKLKTTLENPASANVIKLALEDFSKENGMKNLEFDKWDRSSSTTNETIANQNSTIQTDENITIDYKGEKVKGNATTSKGLKLFLEKVGVSDEEFKALKTDDDFNKFAKRLEADGIKGIKAKEMIPVLKQITKELETPATESSENPASE